MIEVFETFWQIGSLYYSTLIDDGNVRELYNKLFFLEDEGE